MFKRYFLFLACFLCFCNAEDTKAIISKSSEYILLDVRTAEEFKERHIEGAILIPHTEIKERAALELPNKEALILIYCRSGRRSATATQELATLGYTKVHNLGGINEAAKSIAK
ncbi:MAG: rhodanese-like domain-containing protein [Fibromonadaceae bacterium]|jgi:rhodanese-related sulfurtransferase|nr:rhodanese-like domain-containing protein [Fibromonadaceae bacterium]